MKTETREFWIVNHAYLSPMTVFSSFISFWPEQQASWLDAYQSSQACKTGQTRQTGQASPTNRINQSYQIYRQAYETSILHTTI